MPPSKPPVPPQVIVLAEQDVIDTFGSLLAEFMERILGLDPAECLLTDESALSDFFPRGVTLNQAATYPDMVEEWDRAILDKIESQYGLRPERPTIRLVEWLGQLERHLAASSQRH